MKIYLMMLLVALTACSSLKSERHTQIDQKEIPKYRSLKAFSGDTLQFVKHSIFERKAYYSGKKLSVLLKDLQIPVKTYSYLIPHNNKFFTRGLYIDIYSGWEQDEKKKKKLDPVRILVIWKCALPQIQTI